MCKVVHIFSKQSRLNVRRFSKQRLLNVSIFFITRRNTHIYSNYLQNMSSNLPLFYNCIFFACETTLNKKFI